MHLFRREQFIYFLIAFFVVISGIVSAYTLFRQSIRLDEAQSLWASTKTISAILAYIATDVHVPLYELLLHIWLQIFGTSIIAARSLSLLFFLLSIPVLYTLTRDVSNKIMALLTIGLYSLSPFIVWYSYEARMYSLLTLIVCVSHYFFIKLIRSEGEDGEVGYFFSTLFGLYTHYFFILVLITQFVFFIALLLRKRNESVYQKRILSFWVRNKKEIIHFITPVILAVAFFIPWLIYFFMQGLAANTQPLIPAPTTYNIFQTVINFLFGLQSQEIQSFLIALWPLSVVPLFFLFSRRTQQIQFHYIYYFVLATILPVVLVFFASYYRPLFLPRYLILVTPSFFMLIAWSLFHVSKNASRLIISLVAFVMFVFLLSQNISNATPVKENYQGVATYLEEQATARDIIAVSSPFTIYPIMYYYTGPARITTIPEWDLYKYGSIPPFSIESLANQTRSYTQTYQNAYIILSYDQGYEKNIKQYLDTHYQRLTLKKFSTGLELRKYKLRYKG